jgi:hypothetical protein
MYRDGMVKLTAAALLCLVVSSSAQADEMLKFRIITHVTNAQTIEVGDVEGHLIGINRQSGIATFPDGSTATTFFTSSTDYTKGAGPVAGYMNVTFDEGTALWLRLAATTAVDGTRSVFKGTFDVIGGKGKYSGATGDGSYGGIRLTPLAAGADLYADFTVNVKR